MLTNKGNAIGRAVAEVVSTATNSRCIFLRLHLVVAVFTQPCLSIPPLVRAFWSSFGRAHISFVPLTTAVSSSRDNYAATYQELCMARGRDTVVL